MWVPLMYTVYLQIYVNQISFIVELAKITQ